MNMPFYVSPEQMMKDRADYARKGIGRGRSVAVLQYADGVLFVSENPSRALHKISEIYDRIAFAAVGRYNEFENLRIAGVRLADMRGYSYDRRDVTGRGLANAYAQTLGAIFSSGGEKPYEVEIFVAELGATTEDDQIFRLTYDGQVADERGYAAMGGQAESVTSYLAERWRSGLSLSEALRLAVAALGHGEADDRTIGVSDLEAAVLDRTRSRQRKFRRLDDRALTDVLGDGGPGGGPGGGPSGGPGGGDDRGPGTGGAPGIGAEDNPADDTDNIDNADGTIGESSADGPGDPGSGSTAGVPDESAPAVEPAVAPGIEPGSGADGDASPDSGTGGGGTAQPAAETAGGAAPEAASEPPEREDVEDLWPPVAPPPEPGQQRADRPPPPEATSAPASTPGSEPGPDPASDEDDLHDETTEEEWEDDDTRSTQPTSTSQESDDDEGDDDTDGAGWHPFWRGEDR